MGSNRNQQRFFSVICSVWRRRWQEHVIIISNLSFGHFCWSRFKYRTKFSLPKIACPAIVYAEIVVVIDPFFVGVCPWIKVYRYNPTEICQQRLQGVRNVAQKLCSWERSFRYPLFLFILIVFKRPLKIIWWFWHWLLKAFFFVNLHFICLSSFLCIKIFFISLFILFI